MNRPREESALTKRDESALTTSDLVDAGRTPAAQRNQEDQERSDDKQLAALFSPEAAKEFRERWTRVQTGFVDDPKHAVRQADQLVAQVMKTLAETFSKERANLETQLDQKDNASTENLRLALRRYRSFFERLLSL